MRRIFWTSIGAALIVVGVAAAWTQAKQWSGGHGRFWLHHGPFGYVSHELDLSDSQKSQIRSIWKGERPAIGEAIHELASEQREMDALTQQNNTPDEAMIRSITERQGASLAKLFTEKENLTRKIYSQVLTPAQRAKADQLQKNWDTRLDHIADRIGNTAEGK